MLEKLRKFFTVPVFEDEGVNFNARNLNVILLSVFVGMAITILRYIALGKFWQGNAGVVFLATGVVIGGAYILFQKRYILASSMIAIVVLTLMPFALILMSGNGIHDIAIMILPVVVVITSMLLPWQGLVGYVVFIALAFGVLVRMEVNLNLVTPFSKLTTNSDFTDALTILIVAGLMSGLLVASLRRNLRRLSEALKERESSVKQLDSINRIGQSLLTLRETNSVLRLVFEEVKALLPFDGFYIAHVDPGLKRIFFPILYDAGDFFENESVEFSEKSLVGYVVQHGYYLMYETSEDLSTNHHLINIGDKSKNTESIIIVPLKIGTNTVGALSVFSYRPHAFSDEHLSLLTSAAYQIAIALENARLYESERMALEQSETLRESAAVVTATLDKAEAINKILEQLKQVVPYNSASVQLIEMDYLVIVGVSGLPGANIMDFRFPINEQEPSYPVLRERQPYILFANVQEVAPGFNEIPHNGIRSWLAVPLRVKGRIIGIIALDGHEANQFNDRHAGLAVAFANQVAIALENSRLFSEVQQELLERKRAEDTLRQRDAVLQAVAHAAQVFLQSSNWRESIGQVLDELGQVTVTSHAYIFENHILDDGTQVTSQRYEWAAPNVPPDIDNPKYQNMPYDEGVGDWVKILQSGRSYAGNIHTLPEKVSAKIQERGLKSILDVPIFVSGKWWGEIGFDDMDNVREWSASEIEILEVAARMIGAAIERERINESVQTNEERYRTLFEDSPVSLLEEDFSSVKSYIDALKLGGVYDFKEYFETHPEEIRRCVSMVRIVDVNKTILKWYGIKNKAEFHESLDQMLDPNEYGSFVAELEALIQGNGRYELSISRNNLLDGFVHLIVTGTVVPGYEESWERVLISVMDITEQKRAEEALRANEEKVREMNTMLEKRVEERTKQLLTEKARIERIADEVATLRKLSDFLQSSVTIEEASKVVASHMNSLFANTNGGLYLISDGFADLTLTSSWGDFKTESLIQPNDCWGMRRGRSFVRQASDASPICAHFDGGIPDESLCLPLMGQNEIIGMLCLQITRSLDTYFTPDVQNLAIASADSIALALANLRLRERLHDQSIRDALTGLFNRRFMEETLAREVQRASRSRDPLCVVMFEVDDFKVYNNTFGHEAGNYVLKKVADTMRANLRRSDFPCRYGGDEFTLILPETSLEDGGHRAEELRKAVEALALSFNNQALGQVTVRMGVAAYPKHGESGDVVLKVADDASYRARAIGKNCVVVAE